MRATFVPPDERFLPNTPSTHWCEQRVSEAKGFPHDVQPFASFMDAFYARNVWRFFVPEPDGTPIYYRLAVAWLNVSGDKTFAEGWGWPESDGADTGRWWCWDFSLIEPPIDTEIETQETKVIDQPKEPWRSLLPVEIYRLMSSDPLKLKAYAFLTGEAEG